MQEVEGGRREHGLSTIFGGIFRPHFAPLLWQYERVLGMNLPVAIPSRVDFLCERLCFLLLCSHCFFRQNSFFSGTDIEAFGNIGDWVVDFPADELGNSRCC